MSNNQKILLFNVNIFKTSQIKAVCDKLDIEVVTVAGKDYAKQLGALAGISGFGDKGEKSQAKDSTHYVTSEMLVFSGIPDKLLDDFLAGYREAGIAPIQRKAILTPFNIRWTPSELEKQLNTEINQNKRR